MGGLQKPEAEILSDLVLFCPCVLGRLRNLRAPFRKGVIRSNLSPRRCRIHLVQHLPILGVSAQSVEMPKVSCSVSVLAGRRLHFLLCQLRVAKVLLAGHLSRSSTQLSDYGVYQYLP